MGRPSTYHPSIVEVICKRISQGEPLAVICREESMPTRQTIYNWMEVDAAVSLLIARARDDGEEVIASGLREVARGGAGSSGDVQRDKLIVDTDLKLLAKWNPRKWGDKVQQEVSGAGGGPITLVIQPVKTDDKT